MTRNARIPMFCLLAAVVCSFAGMATQKLTADEISVAIEAGKAGKPTEAFCRAASGKFGFNVAIRGPRGRVRLAAEEAKRNLKPFGPADVTSTMLEGTLDVEVTPDITHDLWSANLIASNVVIRPKVAKGAEVVGIQPGQAQQQLGGVAGPGKGQFAVQWLKATFSPDGLPDEFDFVVVAQPAGKYSCHINPKDFAEVR